MLARHQVVAESDSLCKSNQVQARESDSLFWIMSCMQIAGWYPPTNRADCRWGVPESCLLRHDEWAAASYCNAMKQKVFCVRSVLPVCRKTMMFRYVSQAGSPQFSLSGNGSKQDHNPAFTTQSNFQRNISLSGQQLDIIWNKRRSPTALKRPDRSKQCHCLQVAEHKFVFAAILGLRVICGRKHALVKRWETFF